MVSSSAGAHAPTLPTIERAHAATRSRLLRLAMAVTLLLATHTAAKDQAKADCKSNAGCTGNCEVMD
jgi:hypothetical protein